MASPANSMLSLEVTGGTPLLRASELLNHAEFLSLWSIAVLDIKDDEVTPPNKRKKFYQAG